MKSFFSHVVLPVIFLKKNSITFVRFLIFFRIAIPAVPKVAYKSKKSHAQLKWPGLKLIRLEQNIKHFLSLFQQNKFKTSNLQGHRRQIKYLGLEICNLSIQILAVKKKKNAAILLENSAYRELQVLTELIFGLFFNSVYSDWKNLQNSVSFFLLLCGF